MSAATVKGRVMHNAASMKGDLPSTEVLKGYDHCCGIHGAARKRRGIKKGTSAARRRLERELIRKELEENT